MAMDVYAPCPCGSGKKLKFCCQNLAEDMDRIYRMVADNQYRQATQHLTRLNQKQPDHPWVVQTLAIVQIESGDVAAARDLLRPFAERHPELEFATVLHAHVALELDGFEASRPLVARAFQKGIKKHAHQLSGVAIGVAKSQAISGKNLSCRAYLSLALRLSDEERRQDVFLRLLEFDGDRQIPFPLRSAHPLPTITGDDALLAEVQKAQKYISVGCWDTAAGIYEKLTTGSPANAELWHAAGLCWGWAGDEAQAATALHRAAELYADESPAVECETIAQVLDCYTESNFSTLELREAEVSEMGRLLTIFDGHPRLQRIPRDADAEDGMPPSFTLYSVLDRELPAVTDGLSLDNLPRVIGQIALISAEDTDDQKSRLFLRLDEDGTQHSHFELVRDQAGSLAEWGSVSSEKRPFPTAFHAVDFNLQLPAETPTRVQLQLAAEFRQRYVEQNWKHAPQPALQGKTPVEAAAVPELRVKLLAAVCVLDAILLRGGSELDTDNLLRSLNCEPLPPLKLEPGSSLSSLNPLELLRLPVEELGDEQLVLIGNRAMLLHHNRFLRRVLKELIQRPQCLERVDANRIFRVLVDLSVTSQRPEEALESIRKAREVPNSSSGGGQDLFEKEWYWDVQELNVRALNPDDPQLEPMVRKFVDFYCRKIPQLRGYMERILKTNGLPSAWLNSSILTADSAGMAAGGVWTPEGSQPAAGGKLWVPG